MYADGVPLPLRELPTGQPLPVPFRGLSCRMLGRSKCTCRCTGCKLGWAHCYGVNCLRQDG